MVFGPKRRVAVAEDVLKQIRLRKYQATTGVFFNPQGINAYNLYRKAISIGQDLQEILPKLKVCQVCAKGAILASKARLFNDCKLSPLGLSIATKIADEVFGATQAYLIEAAFEGWDAEEASTTKFYHRYHHPTTRLKAIMQNIIDHKGVFKP